ncbi:MAG: hypothetical protein GXY50_03030 [Syntrophomonadaceae bacterium]|nr:hypothetical protein [Syntrophomonadaceae bacterium]
MDRVDMIIADSEKEIQSAFQKIDEVACHNQRRVLEAFRTHRVSSDHFTVGTGYGYNDLGRDTLESMYAEIFGGEDALVRSQLISGTHALSTSLFSLLESGDLLVSAMGEPYDTLQRIISGKNGLEARGVRYQAIPVKEDGGCDMGLLAEVVAGNPRVILLQRSRGYSSIRKTLTIQDIDAVIQLIKSVNPEVIILVDNCYGEFVEKLEPGHVGADLVAGSLIKNPGGGLAAGGGYIIGKRELVELAADRLIAPGLGKEIGPSLYDMRIVYQGLFLAPHVVSEALKGAVLSARALERLGLKVAPGWDEDRGDIVQAIELPDQSVLTGFVRKVQEWSPVDSFVIPEFAAMPGYDHQVIMAAGTFVQGSSIELSCDAPLRQPYWAFFQGGLSYQHIRLVVAQLIHYLLSCLLVENR